MSTPTSMPSSSAFLTIYEGQQRSSPEFIHAATLCREGALGKILRIKVCAGRNKANPVSAAPVPSTLKPEPVPVGLNWDKWLGPMTDSVQYNHELNPLFEKEGDREAIWGAWRWYKPTGGGLMTDWGAHMFDIAQWAIGKDGSGPVEIIPPGYSHYDNLTFIYDNGIIMTEETFDGQKRGVKVYGEKGWIQVCRNEFKCSSPEFEMKKTDKKDAPVNHRQAFINSVISRNDPKATVETGHSTCTVCNLGIIALELGRPIRWNPIVQKFVDDPQATELLHYKYRPGYSIDIE